MITIIRRHESLSLRDNNMFLLLGTPSITGKWKANNLQFGKSSAGDDQPEGEIIFEFEGREVKGILKGNIIYFRSPNVFRAEKYLSTNYVKINTD